LLTYRIDYLTGHCLASTARVDDSVGLAAWQ